MPKLHPHIGVPMHKHRVQKTLAAIAILLVVASLDVSAFRHFNRSELSETAAQTSRAAPVQTVISQEDARKYRTAFAYQQAGRLSEADAALAQVQNSLLVGVVLGERYLTSGNEPSFSEIALWLSRYGNYPQAGDVYRLAQNRAPEDADFLTEPSLPMPLKNFSNRNNRSILTQEKHWIYGLEAYRRDDMETASVHFKALLSSDSADLSSGDRAAAAFWAYRAMENLNDDQAARYLAMAADEPPGFYSILARQVSGEHLFMSERKITSPDSRPFFEKDAVIRAAALKAVGQDALAEKELRAMFLAGSLADRRQLVELAHTLSLPTVQMRMAVSGNYDPKTKGAFYPLPRWTPTSGYRVEPALLFAIIRQESGFNPNAHSGSGATGVMQLMPATAHAMAQDAQLRYSQEPAVSMTLGQRYLERLMELPAIGDNLVYLISAYNAGPGKVEIWQKNIHAVDDPLLFVESIPSLAARDYVESVMGNYWVYCEMLGGYDNTSMKALARNQWPHYERAGKRVVAMISRLGGEGSE